jgi:hypothetical protein
MTLLFNMLFDVLIFHILDFSSIYQLQKRHLTTTQLFPNCLEINDDSLFFCFLFCIYCA